MQKINFPNQQDGYDKFQVDSYVHKISDSYQHIYNEYQKIVCRYNLLLADHNKANETYTPGKYSEALMKELFDTEVIAAKIIDSAQIEADRIVGHARQSAAATYQTLDQAARSVHSLLAAAPQ